MAVVQSIHQQYRATVVQRLARLHVDVLGFPDESTALAALSAYRASSAVEYAEREAYGYVTAVPNDALYSLQWHYPVVNLPAAWDISTGSPVVVAVIDTGIRSHPDLNGVAVAGRDTLQDDSDPTDPGCSTDPEDISHGMHVTGTIVALTNNATGVAGTNWGGVAGTRIMPVRALGEISGVCGVGFASDIAEGIIHATDQGAKVINMSLSFNTVPAVVQDAVDYAAARGVTIVAAAGNDAGTVDYPASDPDVIAVSATACNNTLADYSNSGPEIDVAAPGGDLEDCNMDGDPDLIWSTSWSPSTGNGYFAIAGTSMAAPHVTGLAALLVSRGFTTPAAIKSRLQSTAVDLPPPGNDTSFGAGLIDAGAAVGASVPASMMRAFSGITGGSSITVQSDIVSVSSAGIFLITNAQSGVKTIFVWQDFNGNGLLDSGDLFGRVDGVYIFDGMTTTGVSVITRRYTGGPAMISGSRRTP
jgi:serine protease